MVKRRNSPYATHDRSLPTRVPIDCTPKPAGPRLIFVQAQELRDDLSAAMLFAGH
jgi:hypothetical protein